MRKIIGLGETVLDIIFKGHQVQKAVPGGSTFNAMVSLGRAINADVNADADSLNPHPSSLTLLMVTEVGDDEVGTMITEFLRDNGVATDYVYRHKGTQSHISLAFLNERNDAEYSFYKMHGDLDMPMENIPEISEGDIVLFGSFFAINPKIRGFVSRFLHKAHEAGAILYYDINFRAAHLKDLPTVRPFIEDNIRLATVVRASTEDLAILNVPVAPLGAPLTIVTDADKPVRVFPKPSPLNPKPSPLNPKPSTLNPQPSTLTYPVEAVETVSTIGAGDNFNAGFCYGLCVEDIAARADLSTLSESQIGRLVAHAQRFSAEVCCSLDNYIAKRGSNGK